MIGVREPREQVGKKLSRDGWLWREWEDDWTFARENEFWGTS
jgi:hypothetical protein